MFKKLFSAKWQSKDKSVRHSAINELSPESDFDALAHLATQDNESSIRRAALAKFEQIKPLQQLLEKTKSPDTWCEIASRISEIQPENCKALSVQFQKRQKDWGESAIPAIKKCTSALLAERLLVDCGDNKTLVEAATSAKSIALRLSAVAQITDLETLQKLVKQATHKQVLQLARQQLASLKKEQQEKAENSKEANAIHDALDNLIEKKTTVISEKEFVAKVSVLKQRWSAVDKSIEPALQVKIEQLIKECDAEVSNLKESLLKAERITEATQSQNLVCEQLESILEELSSQQLESQQSQVEALSLLEKTWQQTLDIVPPSPTLKARYSIALEKINLILEAWARLDALTDRIEPLFEIKLPEVGVENEDKNERLAQLNDWYEQWQSLLGELNWPNKTAFPSILVQWQERAESIKKDRQKIIDQKNKACQQLIQKAGKLNGLIRQKNLIAANKLLNYITFEKAKLDQNAIKTVDKRLESIVPELDELRDWHAFATKPKKEQLCTEMQALKGQTISPLALAEKIHQLQDAWHELTSSDSEADQVLWEQFKAAADEAYKPCLSFYAEQDKVRSNNLREKIALCEDLESFLSSVDWESDNFDDKFWRSLDKRYTSITQHWKKLDPIPANEIKRMQSRFGQSITILKARLKTYKQNNLDERLALIKKAEKLTELEDSFKAIEQAKKLQAEWKTIGVTFFKADRSAWQEFRTAIDKVFDKRNADKKAFLDNLQENKKLITEITQSIIKLSKLDDTELQTSKDAFNTLVEKWDRNLALPKKNARQLLKAFDSACEAYQDNFSGIGKRKLIQQYQSLNNIRKKIEQAEEKAFNGETFDVDPLLSALNAASINSELYSVLEKRIKGLEQPADESQSSKNIVRLETLALKAEIALGIDSPEAFKQARMEQQLNQLTAGVGQTNHEKFDYKWLNNFYCQWLEVSSLPQSDRSPLNERLNKIEAKILD